MSRAILLFVLLGLMSKTFGKILSECDLVWELRKQSIPETEIKDWVCLVNAASSRQTDLVGPPGSDGSNDYGIYQISDRYWCETDDKPGKGCSVRCKDLLRDDITAQIECSKIIYAAHGFEAWFGWTEKCKGQTLPEIQSQIECSKIIYAAHGFEAWFGWAEKCKGQTLPEIQC